MHGLGQCHSILIYSSSMAFTNWALISPRTLTSILFDRVQHVVIFILFQFYHFRCCWAYDLYETIKWIVILQTAGGLTSNLQHRLLVTYIMTPAVSSV